MRAFLSPGGRIGLRQVAAASLAAVALVCLWQIHRVPGALQDVSVDHAVPNARVDAVLHAHPAPAGSDDLDDEEVYHKEAPGVPATPGELDVHAAPEPPALPQGNPVTAPDVDTTTTTTTAAASPSPTPAPDTTLDVTAPPPASPASARRISVLVIWEGGFPFPLLANFFASFAHNAPLVELVWIGIRPEDGGACLDVSPFLPTAPADVNIKDVCLSREEYWGMHVDYFCAEDKWNCNQEEREEAMRVFLDRHQKDRNKSLYRIWRGYIFRKYVDPAAEWWGWADVDTFMGSYESMFPWDVASQFDVLIPAHTTHQLYLRGHLAFIQTREETEKKMNYYENMSTLRNFVDLHGDAWWCAEEAEFSAFVLRDTRISFFLFPSALAEPDTNRPPAQLATFSSYAGTFHTSALPAPAFPAARVLRLPAAPAPRRPTFSDAGEARAVELRLGGHSWVPSAFVTEYEVDWNRRLPAGGDALRYLGRGGGMAGGAHGVWERLEPARPKVVVTAVGDGGADDGAEVELLEGLYVHWFRFKYDRTELFRGLPTETLAPGQAFVEFWNGGAEVWDVARGERVWQRASETLLGEAVRRRRRRSHRGVRVPGVDRTMGV